METAIVTTKGQIVIPVEIRRRHGITKGTRVSVVERGDEIVLRPVTDKFIEQAKGSLHTGGRALKALLADRRKDRDR